MHRSNINVHANCQAADAEGEATSVEAVGAAAADDVAAAGDSLTLSADAAGVDDDIASTVEEGEDASDLSAPVASAEVALAITDADVAAGVDVLAALADVESSPAVDMLIDWATCFT